MVLALDAQDGQGVWQREAHRGKPPRTASQEHLRVRRRRPRTESGSTSPSEATSACSAIRARGRSLWKQSLDASAHLSRLRHRVVPGRPRRARLPAPRLTRASSFLVALRPGRERLPEGEPHGQRRAARSRDGRTPFVWQNELRTEIVTVGRGLVISYDSEGHELWRLKGITQATPTPVAGEGLLFVGSGSQGENSRPLFAIRPGAAGDISTGRGSSRSRFRELVPAPLLPPTPGRRCSTEAGCTRPTTTASCRWPTLRPERKIYKARVGGGGITFFELALASAGRIYLLSEDGDTFVLEAGDEYKRAREEQPGRDEPGQSCSRRRRLVPANPDEAVPGAGPGAFEAVSGPSLAGTVPSHS